MAIDGIQMFALLFAVIIQASASTINVTESVTTSLSSMNVSKTDSVVVNASTAVADSASTTGVTSGGVQPTATATLEESVQASTTIVTESASTSFSAMNVSETSGGVHATATATLEESVQATTPLSMTSITAAAASDTTTGAMSTFSMDTPLLQSSSSTPAVATTPPMTTGLTSTSSVIAPTSSSTVVQPTAQIDLEDRMNGIAFTLQLNKCGLSITNINSAVTESLEKAFNGHCGQTNATIAECCVLPLSSIPVLEKQAKKFLSPGNIKVADNFPLNTCATNKLKLEYVVVVVVETNNSLCTWAKTPARVRRAVAIPPTSYALPPSVAVSIFNQTISAVESDIGTAINATVQVQALAFASIVYPQITTTETTTPTNINTTAIPVLTGLETWMIALIVVGSVLAFFIIFVIVYIICKKVCFRGSKVDDQEMRSQQVNSSPH